jgi:hypothetical protein
MGTLNYPRLFSSMLSIETANSDNNIVYCHVVNVSTLPVSGEVSILDCNNNLLTAGPFENLAPGKTCSTALTIFNPPLPSTTLLYGRLTLKVMDANMVRASLIITNQKGVTLAVSELR